MKIQLDHLTKKFKNTVAVCDMNCTIEDGEMVCLLWPFRLWKKYNIIDDCGVRAANGGRNLF